MSVCKAIERLLTISIVKSTGSGQSTETLWISGMCDIKRSADHQVRCLNLYEKKSETEEIRSYSLT